MLHPLASLFKKSSVDWDVSDTSFFVENFLKERIRTEALHCERIDNDKIVIRVGTSALKQEVILLEFELLQALEDDIGVKGKKIQVYS